MQSPPRSDLPRPRANAIESRDSETYLLVDQGTTIFREGERGICAYVLERGRVEISVERAGQKVVLAHRGPGEVFGEMAIIDDKPRSATVTALEPCDLLMITSEQLANRMREADPLVNMCLNVVLERFRTTLLRLQAIDCEHLLPLDPVRDEDDAHDSAIREIKLEQELRRALRQEEFELHYQPIVDLGTERLAGFEALIRWHHKERGLVPPMVFVPTAEASGLIVPMGQWSFRQACVALGDLAKPRTGGGPTGAPLFMSINFSVRDFSDSRFVRQLEQQLAETGVDPRQIKLEITETLLMQKPDLAAATLRQCKDLGLSIAIDDFGTGYSSLSYLHKFPIDTLKIDRSFTREMHRSEQNFQIVRSIINLASQLDLDVVAEGIELPEQVTMLQDLGCRFGQGFHYARPQPWAAAAELVAEWAGAGAGAASPAA